MTIKELSKLKIGDRVKIRENGQESKVSRIDLRSSHQICLSNNVWHGHKGIINLEVSNE